ncbi:MAG: hypothetical protein MUO24_02135 [Desulfobacterales bacterium]|nr:hypothetical protein [Desulfobacterales bacterium]
MITFVVATHRKEVFDKNIGLSRIFSDGEHEFIIKENHTNPQKAYNEGIEESRTDIVVLLHEDVYCPIWFEAQLIQGIKALSWAEWGVLGAIGADADGKLYGHMMDRGNDLGTPIPQPVEVASLVEPVLVIKKSNGLRLDETMPNHTLYGTDLCMQARIKGLKCFVIDAFIHHNSTSKLGQPGRDRETEAEFQRSVSHIRDKWKVFLPLRLLDAHIEELP